MRIENSSPYKSARYVTNISSAERGISAANKVDGASYEVISTQGSFSTAEGQSYDLGKGEVGVKLTFKDFLSKARYRAAL